MDTVLEKLKRARRSFDGLPQVTILEDWCNDNQNDQWYIKIQIEIEQSSQYVPNKTSWYIVVSSVYPFGKIKIYPSIENSITVTFPHQTNNAMIDSSGLWRTGALCTEVIDRLYESEPFGVDSRIFFHVRRAIFWLEDAANGNLILDGDLFELPYFNTDKNPLNSVVFSEDVVSYMQWEDISATCGTATLYRVPNSNMVIFRTDEFKSSAKQEKSNLHHIWGSVFTNTTEGVHTAIWIKLHSVPVMNVWQAPITLLELKQACQSQGVELFELLKECVPYIRDNKRHILLIGFPIPKHFNKEDEIIFWQALLLPYLSAGKLVHNGFRPCETGWWLRDKAEVLKDNLELEWLESENWSEREISLRGQLPSSIRISKVVIIGCGTLGATIAELLVRAGVHKLQLIDNDIVKVGNLTRHILTTSDIGRSKSEAVANRLNNINPHARVTYSGDSFFLQDDGNSSVDINNADIILDCTGEDSVLTTLSALSYRKKCRIISISIGLQANRVYVNMQNALFQYDRFLNVISKYLIQDEAIAKEMELPRDGTGCWHPTFPARADDVFAVATLVLKVIDTYISSEDNKELTLVFEKNNQYGFFVGYKIIEKVEHE